MSQEILPIETSSRMIKAAISTLVQKVGVDIVAEWCHSQAGDVYKYANPNEHREIPSAKVHQLARQADLAGYKTLARLFHSEKSRLVEAKYGTARGEFSNRIIEAHAKLGELSALGNLGDPKETFSKFEELETTLLDIRAEISAMHTKFEREMERKRDV